MRNISASRVITNGIKSYLIERGAEEEAADVFATQFFVATITNFSRAIGSNFLELPVDEQNARDKAPESMKSSCFALGVALIKAAFGKPESYLNAGLPDNMLKLIPRVEQAD